MYTTVFILSLFIPPGISLPIFPVASPYIPSGLGPLPSITTNAYNVPRGLVNTQEEIVTGPIPEKWKHTHGTLSPVTKTERQYLGGECGEGVGCAGLIDDLKEINKKIKDELKEKIELEGRDLGDCKPWMWGC
ncbi:uncharacterized protein ALTATR162_LOCUS11578 [Alternaria atra]|uniref:Uncharacterized protein n=1 Tax=Alternaria atra TaxID=119953 RepID=A0A8J2ID32_9PLEO|nr:uncharacterized protein ALTATR162_LOCUS11578 [Alternaria atra]CAG5186410.1 unnamed protein product [Alternaria atra]